MQSVERADRGRQWLQGPRQHRHRSSRNSSMPVSSVRAGPLCGAGRIRRRAAPLQTSYSSNRLETNFSSKTAWAENEAPNSNRGERDRAVDDRSPAVFPVLVQIGHKLFEREPRHRLASRRPVRAAAPRALIQPSRTPRSMTGYGGSACGGTISATARPRSVMTTVSPAAASRTYSLSLFLGFYRPTAFAFSSVQRGPIGSYFGQVK